MDYKQKYESLMKNIEHLHASVNPEWKQTIECYIPELKESGDKEIRKGLIDFLKSPFINENITDEKVSPWIAWLEKQGEQPDANKEYWRGYREGKQEIIDKYSELEKQCEQKPDTNCLLSWSEMDEKMLQSLEGIVKDYWAKAEQEKNEIKIREASNVSYFLKTIQKSPLCWIKCSDELPNRDGIYLVVTDGRHNDVYDMARYDSIEGWHKASEIIYWMPIPQLNNKSIIEQKPADNIEKPWSEEDERIYQSIMDDTVQENQLDDKQINWLKSLKDRVQPQPRQEWSEEDEKYINDLIAYFAADMSLKHTEEDIVNWLKSIRPQSQWKPSVLPHWQKSNLPNNNTTGFNSDYFCHKGYCINYKELFEKLPKDD